MPTSAEGDEEFVVALDKRLATARLVIRPPEASDAARTWAYRRVDSVSEWLTGRSASLEEYTERFFEPKRLSVTTIVELASDATVVGDLMIRVQDAWSQAGVREQAARKEAELGWCLDPDHTGQGYATEAVREVLRYCFEDLGIHRVIAICFTANEPSWRLMERVGMRREAHSVADGLHETKGWMDSYTYAILADEWRDSIP